MKSKVEVEEEERYRDKDREKEREERERIHCFNKHLKAIMTWYSNRKKYYSTGLLRGGGGETKQYRHRVMFIFKI